MEPPSPDLGTGAAPDTDIVSALPEFIDTVSHWVEKWYQISGPGYMIRASQYTNAYFVAAQVSGGYRPEAEPEDIVHTESGRPYLWGIWAVGCGTGLEPRSTIRSIEPVHTAIMNDVADHYSLCESGEEIEDPLSFNDPDLARLQSFVDSLPDTADASLPDLPAQYEEWCTGIVYAFSEYISRIASCLNGGQRIHSIGYMTIASQCKETFFVAAQLLPEFSLYPNAEAYPCWGIWAVRSGSDFRYNENIWSIDDTAYSVSLCPRGQDCQEPLTLSDPDAARLLAFLETQTGAIIPDAYLAAIAPALPTYIYRCHTPKSFSLDEEGYMIESRYCKNAYFVAARVTNRGDYRIDSSTYDYRLLFNRHTTRFGADNVWGIWAVGCGTGFEAPSEHLSIEPSGRTLPLNGVARSFSPIQDQQEILNFPTLSDPDVARLLAFLDSLPKDTDRENEYIS